MVDFKDFQKVQNMEFDISKLKKGLEEVLKIKKYDSANGIPNFAAICLNQIPGDPDSTKGNKARGVFWTKPNDSGKEVSRDIPINEDQYTEFVKDFESPEVATQIEKEINELRSSGIPRLSVPKFLIQGKEPTGRSVEAFSAAIDKELKKG